VLTVFGKVEYLGFSSRIEVPPIRLTLNRSRGRLATVASADSIEVAAEPLWPPTACTQLKAIFAKTETHRQSQRLALLFSRLPSGRSK